MARAPKKPARHLSIDQAVEEIARLCAHYRFPRNNDGALSALVQAIVEGVVKVPRDLHPRKRGRPPIWQGDVGLELVIEIEKIRNGVRRRRKPQVAVAVELLQEREPEKWGRYDARELEKRYYDARKHWYYKMLSPRTK
jgi:hypothetical protein